MIIVGPVRHRAQRIRGSKYIWFRKQTHQRDKSSIGTAINTDMRRVDAIIFYEPVYTINLVSKVLPAHVTINPRSPVTAISCTATIVNVQYKVTVICEHIVKHKFTKIIA